MAPCSDDEQDDLLTEKAEKMTKEEADEYCERHILTVHKHRTDTLDKEERDRFHFFLSLMGCTLLGVFLFVTLIMQFEDKAPNLVFGMLTVVGVWYRFFNGKEMMRTCKHEMVGCISVAVSFFILCVLPTLALNPSISSIATNTLEGVVRIEGDLSKHGTYFTQCMSEVGDCANEVHPSIFVIQLLALAVHLGLLIMGLLSMCAAFVIFLIGVIIFYIPMTGVYGLSLFFEPGWTIRLQERFDPEKKYTTKAREYWDSLDGRGLSFGQQLLMCTATGLLLFYCISILVGGFTVNYLCFVGFFAVLAYKAGGREWVFQYKKEFAVTGGFVAAFFVLFVVPGLCIQGVATAKDALVFINEFGKVLKDCLVPCRQASELYLNAINELQFKRPESQMAASIICSFGFVANMFLKLFLFLGVWCSILVFVAACSIPAGVYALALTFFFKAEWVQAAFECIRSLTKRPIPHSYLACALRVCATFD